MSRFPALIPGCLALGLLACGGGDDGRFVSVDVAWKSADVAPRVRVVATGGAALEIVTGKLRVERTNAATVAVEILDETLRLTCKGGRLRVSVPAGGTLDVAADTGAVRVAGEWVSVNVRTRDGDVQAAGVFVKAATLRSNSGSLDLSIPSPHRGALSCVTTTGDIAVRVPLSSSGQVYLFSGVAKLTVPKHARFWNKLDQKGQGLNGWLGKKPTVGERQAQTSGQAEQPPSVLARTTTGGVMFALKPG